LLAQDRFFTLLTRHGLPGQVLTLLGQEALRGVFEPLRFLLGLALGFFRPALRLLQSLKLRLCLP
jgi:hypothetical protein